MAITIKIKRTPGPLVEAQHKDQRVRVEGLDGILGWLKFSDACHLHKLDPTKAEEGLSTNGQYSNGRISIFRI